MFRSGFKFGIAKRKIGIYKPCKSIAITSVVDTRFQRLSVSESLGSGSRSMKIKEGLHRGVSRKWFSTTPFLLTDKKIVPATGSCSREPVGDAQSTHRALAAMKTLDMVWVFNTLHYAAVGCSNCMGSASLARISNRPIFFSLMRDMRNSLISVGLR
jgi:hypothetical protein